MSKRILPLWTMINAFLNEYMTELRKLSDRTVGTYKECLTDFSIFLRDSYKLRFKDLDFEHFERKSVKAYIKYLQDKGLKERTCNLRLAVIKSFLAFCSDEDIELAGLYHEVKSIPALRIRKDPIVYLSEPQMESLLNQPNCKTKKGYRDRILMTYLYDSASRVQELVNARVGDLHINDINPFVTIKGKGNKLRNVPLMEKTVQHLKTYLSTYHVRQNDFAAPLFYSCKTDGSICNLSTDAISWMLKKYGDQARKRDATIPISIHPHLFRTTRAMHLYVRKMPIEYISKFLGHSSITTTSLIYAYANLEMLSMALEAAEPEIIKGNPRWSEEEIRKVLRC